jgi:hypothetical protein
MQAGAITNIRFVDHCEWVCCKEVVIANSLQIETLDIRWGDFVKKDNKLSKAKKYVIIGGCSCRRYFCAALTALVVGFC